MKTFHTKKNCINVAFVSWLFYKVSSLVDLAPFVTRSVGLGNSNPQILTINLIRNEAEADLGLLPYSIWRAL